MQLGNQVLFRRGDEDYVLGLIIAQGEDDVGEWATLYVIPPGEPATQVQHVRQGDLIGDFTTDLDAAEIARTTRDRAELPPPIRTGLEPTNPPSPGVNADAIPAPIGPPAEVPFTPTTSETTVPDSGAITEVAPPETPVEPSQMRPEDTADANTPPPATVGPIPAGMTERSAADIAAEERAEAQRAADVAASERSEADAAEARLVTPPANAEVVPPAPSATDSPTEARNDNPA